MKHERIQSIHPFLDPYIRGKRMLDIGSIGHNFEHRDAIGTLYIKDFNKVAGSVTGIDILEEDVARAQAAGLPVVVGNAETYVAEEPVEVIFAGELIEHLSNAGLFLDGCWRNLVDGGKLVLTTPNAFSISRLFRVLVRRTNEPPLNPEHTCYYTPLTLEQLVLRHGFAVEKLVYQDYDYGEGAVGGGKSAMLKVNNALSAAFPQFSQTLIMVLKKVPKG